MLASPSPHSHRVRLRSVRVAVATALGLALSGIASARDRSFVGEPHRRRGGLGPGRHLSVSCADGKPSLEETLRDAYSAGVRFFGDQRLADGGAPAAEGIKWSIQEERYISEANAMYTRFRIDHIPEGQGQNLGNLLRRTLLREDLFRCHAVVAFRAHRRAFKLGPNHVPMFERPQRAVHEHSCLSGVHESMINIIPNLRQLQVAPSAVEAAPVPLVAMASDSEAPQAWRWALRRCGPCAVEARDFEIVDSADHYEEPTEFVAPQQYVCRVTGRVMFELEVEAVRASQAEWEWEDHPQFKKYKQRLLHDGWLMVPPLFSPILKVNYQLGKHEGYEVVELEVWSKVSRTPREMVNTAAASLLAALRAHLEKEQLGSSEDSDEEEEEEEEEEDWGEAPGSQSSTQGGAPRGGASREESAWDELVNMAPAVSAAAAGAARQAVDGLGMSEESGFGEVAQQLRKLERLDDLPDPLEG